jgi:hypothetical protein
MSTHVTTPTTASTDRPAGAVTRYAPTVARILLGLLFLLMGAVGLLMAVGIIATPPQPADAPAASTALFAGMAASKYMLPLVNGTELVVGVLLLSNRYVPLALALLAPVLVNIVAYHLVLVPSGLVLAVPLLALEIYLAWSYRSVYRPMLAAKVKRDGVAP